MLQCLAPVKVASTVCFVLRIFSGLTCSTVLLSYLEANNAVGGDFEEYSSAMFTEQCLVQLVSTYFSPFITSHNRLQEPLYVACLCGSFLSLY